MTVLMTLMFDYKALFLSVIVAALVGVLFAFLATTLFPGFTNASPLIKGAVIGAPCGLIYPLLARRNRI